MKRIIHSALTKRFVVKITVERCDKIKVAVSHIFDRVKSVALWSANIRKLAKDHKIYGVATRMYRPTNIYWPRRKSEVNIYFWSINPCIDRNGRLWLFYHFSIFEILWKFWICLKFLKFWFFFENLEISCNFWNFWTIWNVDLFLYIEWVLL